MNKLFFSWPQKDRVLPIICVCVGQVIWGFSYLFTRIAQRAASPTVVLSMRFLASWAVGVHFTKAEDLGEALALTPV